MKTTDCCAGVAVRLEARDRLKEALAGVMEKQTLRAYARSIRVAPATVSKWLAGDSFPDGDNRERVAGSLGMSLDRFNAAIIRGEAGTPINPLHQTLQWIDTASRSDLATILHAVADKLIDR